MSYKKPEVVAESDRKSSYVAGCPANYAGNESSCRNCDRAQ